MTTDILRSQPPVVRTLLSLVDPGLHFLQNHVWLDVGSESDFSASLAVGRVIMEVAECDSSVISRLSEHGAEVCYQSLLLRLLAENCF